MIFIDAAEVAHRLGLRDALAFLRIRNRLEELQDFPPPVPISSRPLKWRADAIDAWLSGQGLARPEPLAPAPGGNVVLLQEARRE